MEKTKWIMQFHTIPDNGVILTNFFPAAVVQNLIIS